MAWPTLSPRRVPKDTGNKESRAFVPPSSRDPPPRRHQAVETLQIPPQARFHGPIPARAGVIYERQHPALSRASSREVASGDNWKHGTTRVPRDARVSSSSTDTVQKGKGVEKRPDQQGGGAREADADGEGRSKSIWERTAAKTGGHDGGHGSTFRNRTPLPSWLRDP